MKNYLMLVVLFTTVFIFSGCTSKQTTQNNDPGANNDKMGRRMPDFGQPKEAAEIMGLVTKIVGNEVTVLKIERPDMASSTRANGAPSQNPGGDNNRPANADRGAGGAGFRPGGGTGGGAAFGGMGARPGGGAMDAESQAAMLARMKEMSSGEEVITIPVGIQMMKPDTESTGTEPKMLEATLSDIKANSMITVWLNKDVTDKKVASFVMVR